ncbi:MAG: hypothetical protein AB7S26_02055 [Sandaracinaceae bacterium]
MHVLQQRGHAPVAQADPPPSEVVDAIARWAPDVGPRAGYAGEDRPPNAQAVWDAYQRGVPSADVVTRVAQSYALEPATLLAILHLEGGMAPSAGPVPASVERTALVSFYLWSVYGMDDYAITSRAPGATDNDFDWAAAPRQRSAAIHQLGLLARRGLLPDGSGLRAASPADQIAPVDVWSRLASGIRANGSRDPHAFARWAIPIVAASVAMRESPVAMPRSVLGELGYSSADAADFSHGGVARAERAGTVDALYARGERDRIPIEIVRLMMGTPASAARIPALLATHTRRWNAGHDARVALCRWADDHRRRGTSLAVIRAEVEHLDAPRWIRRLLDTRLTSLDPIVLLADHLPDAERTFADPRGLMRAALRYDPPSHIEPALRSLYAYVVPQPPSRRAFAAEGLETFYGVLRRFQGMRAIADAELGADPR